MFERIAPKKTLLDRAAGVDDSDADEQCQSVMAQGYGLVSDMAQNYDLNLKKCDFAGAALRVALLL